MPLHRVAVLGSHRLTMATLRTKFATRRNHFYLKSEKLWESLSAGFTKKILCSGMPEWTDEIKRGFRYSPHQVNFGSITEESFRQYDIVVPLGLTALREARRRSQCRRVHFHCRLRNPCVFATISLSLTRRSSNSDSADTFRKWFREWR